MKKKLAMILAATMGISSLGCGVVNVSAAEPDY